MHQRLSNAAQFNVLAHSGLKAHFDSPNAPLNTIRSGLNRIDFIDDDELAALGGALDLPLLIPVTSEFQAERLQALRVRHPLSLLIAITTDISGFRTYYAIRSGANFVLNLAIPDGSQIDMLYAQLRAHHMTTPVGIISTSLQAVPADCGALREDSEGRGDPAREAWHMGRAARSIPSPDAGFTPGDERSSQPASPKYDRELVRLLCTSMTVSEIARHYYCSERSMYRRIRRLYNELGVRGRAELISLTTVLDKSAIDVRRSTPSASRTRAFHTPDPLMAL